MAPTIPDERAAQILGSRVMRPTRAQLKKARAAAAHLKDPREAWEVLATAGLIPESWVGSKERLFRGGWGKAAPPSVEAAVLFAADAPNVARAEELARECAHRLRALGYAAPVAPVRWHVISPAGNASSLAVEPAWWELGAAARALLGPAFANVRYVPQTDRTSDALFRGASEGRALTDPRLATTRGAELLSRMVDEAMRALWAARGWYLAARERAVVRDTEPARDDAPDDDDAWLRPPPRPSAWRRASEAGWTGREVAELPDPFDPLLQLWGTGYAPGAFDDALTLYALDR